jgi:hypothetical protein
MRRFAVLLLLLALVLLPTASAWANSGPPPARLWFAFQDDTGQALSPQAVQLAGCDGDCSAEILLQSYGVCNQPGCLPGQPALQNWADEFGCSPAQPSWETIPTQSNRQSTVGLCRAASYDYSGQYRLVAQIDGQVYTSDLHPFQDSQAITDWEQAFRVVVAPSGLSLVENPDFEAPAGYWPSFIPSFLLTLAIELLVAGLYLGLGLKLRSATLGTLLALVALADLVTFPLVWFFFPSFAPFTPPYNKALGYFLLLAGLLFTGLMAILFLRTEGRKRWISVGVACLLAVLVIPVCSIAVLFATSYGNNSLATGGLPGSWLLLASEIFAVLFEAGFLYFLSRKALPLRHAFLLSLLMNLASYLAGLAIVQIL